jgi:hypothetical protein
MNFFGAEGEEKCNKNTEQRAIRRPRQWKIDSNHQAHLHQ